jgi:hypothetical protein
MKVLAGLMIVFGVGLVAVPASAQTPAPTCVPVADVQKGDIALSHNATHEIARVLGDPICDGVTLAIHVYPKGVPLGTPFEQTFPQKLSAASSPATNIATLTARLPPCAVIQADAVKGPALAQVDADHQYDKPVPNLIATETFETTECATASTSVAAATTTTTAPAVVSPTTTSAAPEASTREEVAAVTQVPPPVPPASAPSLARTGSSSTPLVYVGLGLILGGVLLLLGTWRQRQLATIKNQ